MNWKLLIRPIASIVGVAAVLLGLSAGLTPVAASNAQATQDKLMAALLPDSTSFVEEEYTGEDELIQAVYKGESGYVVRTAAPGYVGDVVLLVGVNDDGTVTGLAVQEQNETFGLGGRVQGDRDFLVQFLGTSGEAVVGEDIDALTGATVTSKAVTKAVNAAAVFVTGADVSSSATEWG